MDSFDCAALPPSIASDTTKSGDVTSVQRIWSKLIPFAAIPSFPKRILRMTIKGAYNIDPPCDYQLETIHHLATNDDTYLVLIRQTADGKLLVLLTVTLLRTGIVTIIVPLHGLGSNQVEKTNIPDYVEEHKRSDATTWRNRLLLLTLDELQHTTCILFVSPNALPLIWPGTTRSFAN